MSDPTDRAQRFRDLFDAVTNLSSRERAAYLERECSDDIELRAWVERLSAADDDMDTDVGALFDALRSAVLAGDGASESDSADLPASFAADVVLGELQDALEDQYSVEREIGRGGMATVYLAHDRKHSRPVAVKVLRPDLAAAIGPERFLQEIRVTAKLNHPHILTLLDSGEADGFLYYVMPFVDGESLRDRLDREKKLSIDDALRIARDVSEALNWAHEHGVIHRDIKPENILLEGEHALLADFGIARAIESAGGESLTKTGSSIGTPSYMSPEQADSTTEVDGRADIYSLGCVLYEMIAGEPPYTGPSARDVLIKSLVDPVPSLRRVRRAVPPAMDAAISRALAKTPADRFATPAEFSLALSATLTLTAPRTWSKQTLLMSLAGVAVAALALTLGWDGLSNWFGSDTPAVAGERALTIVADVDGSAAGEIRDVARSLVAAAIDESGILRALSADEIERGLEMAGASDTATGLPLQAARELAFRGSIRSVVASTIDRIGETYAVTIRVVDADAGSVIAMARGSASSEDELVDALDEVVQRLRGQLGERPTEIQATRPSGEAWTSSFEAYRLYVLGWELAVSGDFAGALDLYREALQHDPEFASAMFVAGMAHANLGAADSAVFWGTRAYELSERLTPVERLVLESVFAEMGGDLAGSIRIKQRMIREFQVGYDGLANTYHKLGRYEEAVALMQEQESGSPFGLSAILLMNRASWLLPLGRFDEARQDAERLTGDFQHIMKAGIAGAAAEWAVAESLSASFVQRPDVRVSSHYLGAFVLWASAQAAQGRIHEAIETLDRGTRFYSRRELDPSAGPTRQARLILNVAVDGAMESIPLPSVDVDTSFREHRLAALWDSWIGDTASAAALFSRTGEAQPMSPASIVDPDQAQRLLLRARVAAAAGRWDEVILLLEPVAAPTASRSGLPFSQLARWTLAEAHERTGDLESAVTYFDMISSYQGFSDTDQKYRGLTHSFAHRRSALLYTELGDIDQAEEHWQIFLDDFSDPDPELQWMVEEGRAAVDLLAPR